ncbi:MAG: putative transcriptional repressor LexA [Firmicutes bacterium]|nr:putative transcriptional repressor LexA [Bacillota bacterium]
MKIGEKIAELRNKKGLSQNDLAKISNIGQGRISQIESGKNPSPTTATLQKIANALGVSMAEFDDNTLSLERAYKLADTMNLDKKRKEALAKIKALPVDEQQERLNRNIEKLKSLPPETRKAIELIIENLPASPRQ